VTDADGNAANGIQLTGTAAQINTALAAATFTAATAGAASIGVSVSDGVNDPVVATYNMTASAVPAQANAAPTLVTNFFATDTDGANHPYGAGTVENNAYLSIDGAAQSVQKISANGVTDGGWLIQTDTGGSIAGKTVTFSAWLWGVGSVSTVICDDTWGGSGNWFTSTIELTSTPTRYSFTTSFNNSYTGNNVAASFAGASVGHEFSVSGIQLEEGANMSAYVARNGTAGTVLTGDGLNAEELATGFTMNVDLNGQTLAAGHAVQIVDQLGNVWGQSSTLTVDADGVVSVLVKQSLDNVVADGTYQLASRFINVQTGATGDASIDTLSVTVDTGAVETIGSFGGDDVIRGGAGNDNIFLTTGGQDTVVFDMVSGFDANATGGNGFDVITGFTFAQGANQDSIVLDGLLLGYEATGALQTDTSTLDTDFLKLFQLEANLGLFVDRDGAGDAYGNELIALFVDTQRSDINNAVNQWDALYYMLENSILVVL
jgi:hypothetical protein